ncbi:MAG: M48 family metalloprotease [Candidatus Omnitrophica bacterium]|nr:M48 family metalloprotease [Candidatus Omnitrophota bacterium]
MAGCATPQYALRPAPMPEESGEALHIERAISAVQGKEFEQEGARPIGPAERLRGFEVQPLVDRLSRVTERPSLRYRAYLYPDEDPNAAALADGRIYLSTGMINYLAQRGGRPDELAFVLSHEIAHTVAQHLVKRYRTMQQRQLLIALVAAGASAATQQASPAIQQAGQVAVNAASLLKDVADSGFSQEQELEADQLGIRYVIQAGFEPKAALALLQDFERFENPSPFLRTHPYVAIRRQYLERYLAETGRLGAAPAGGVDTRSSPAQTAARTARLKQWREAQRLYPVGSVSWNNLQRQIDALEAQR